MNSQIQRLILCCASTTLLTFAPSSSARPAERLYLEQCPSGGITMSPESCCDVECTFNGAVSGWIGSDEPIVKWEVSGGKIISGQGGWSIKVRAGEARDKLTVTLKVTGKELPRPCEVKVVYEAPVCPKGCRHKSAP